MRKNRILVVEDELKLARTLSDFLKINGYEVIVANDGQQAVELFYQNMHKLDLVLLDIMLPHLNGFEVLGEIRQKSEVPVILLTAKNAITDQLNGFNKGADDYITKPYTLAIIKAHVEAVLKRAGKLKDVLSAGELRIEIASQKVYLKEEFMETTPKEVELLVYFLENENVVLSREAILNSVWGYDYNGDTRTVDTIVKQLRKKMTDQCPYIKSVYGVGYLFGVGEHD